MSRQSNVMTPQGSSQVVHKTTDAGGLTVPLMDQLAPNLVYIVMFHVKLSQILYIVIIVSIGYIGHVRGYLKARV